MGSLVVSAGFVGGLAARSTTTTAAASAATIGASSAPSGSAIAAVTILRPRSLVNVSFRALL